MAQGIINAQNNGGGIEPSEIQTLKLEAYYNRRTMPESKVATEESANVSIKPIAITICGAIERYTNSGRYIQVTAYGIEQGQSSYTSLGTISTNNTQTADVCSKTIFFDGKTTFTKFKVECSVETRDYACEFEMNIYY